MKKSVLFILLISTRLHAATQEVKTCRPPLKEFTVAQLSYADTDLFKVYSQEIKAFKNRGVDESGISLALQIQNTLELSKLQNRPLSIKSGVVKAADAAAILKSIFSHPVISAKASLRYDPAMQIGFCFGRAANRHASLLCRAHKAPCRARCRQEKLIRCSTT